MGFLVVISLRVLAKASGVTAERPEPVRSGDDEPSQVGNRISLLTLSPSVTSIWKSCLLAVKD